MPRRNRSRERPEPDLLEYSFEDCPQLSSCCQYEYLASSGLVLEAVERHRAGQNDPSAKAVALLFGPDIHWTLSPGLWPRPYQSLLMEQRALGRAPSPQPNRRRSPELAELVTPWIYLLDPKEAARVVPIYVNPYLTPAQLKKAVIELLQRDYPHLLSKSAKPQLPQAFLDLVRRKDPQLFEEYVKTRSKPGGGSWSEQYQADLKALTAWRLSRRFHYPAQSAIDLLRAHRLDTYEDVRSFRRGVRRATERIAALEERLIGYAEKMTA